MELELPYIAMTGDRFNQRVTFEDAKPQLVINDDIVAIETMRAFWLNKNNWAGLPRWVKWIVYTRFGQCYYCMGEPFSEFDKWSIPFDESREICGDAVPALAGDWRQAKFQRMD